MLHIHNRSMDTTTLTDGKTSDACCSDVEVAQQQSTKATNNSVALKCSSNDLSEEMEVESGTLPICEDKAEVDESEKLDNETTAAINDSCTDDTVKSSAKPPNKPPTRKRTAKKKPANQTAAAAAAATFVPQMMRNTKPTDCEWNGHNLVSLITSAFEFQHDAKISWFCHCCIRSDEDYEETKDVSVHIDCPDCRRTWHSQCYETQFPHDKEFWTNSNDSDRTPCFNCRVGIWNCLLCGENGYENLPTSTLSNTTALMKPVYRCTEPRCTTRCHRTCVENELLRPKTCFAASSGSSNRRLKQVKVEKIEKVSDIAATEAAPSTIGYVLSPPPATKAVAASDADVIVSHAAKQEDTNISPPTSTRSSLDSSSSTLTAAKPPVAESNGGACNDSLQPSPVVTSHSNSIVRAKSIGTQENDAPLPSLSTVGNQSSIITRGNNNDNKKVDAVVTATSACKPDLHDETGNVMPPSDLQSLSREVISSSSSASSRKRNRDFATLFANTTTITTKENDAVITTAKNESDSQTIDKDADASVSPSSTSTASSISLPPSAMTKNIEPKNLLPASASASSAVDPIATQTDIDIDSIVNDDLAPPKIKSTVASPAAVEAEQAVEADDNDEADDNEAEISTEFLVETIISVQLAAVATPQPLSAPALCAQPAAAISPPPSFYFKCGRHQCSICKRLGRSVTCHTEDGTARQNDSICVENVKNGSFQRVTIISCLRCCRAVHFHPHCFPPVYLPIAYNPNLMLCEEHVMNQENDEYLKRQQEQKQQDTTPATTKAPSKRKRKRAAAGRKPKAGAAKARQINETTKAELTTCCVCGKEGTDGAEQLTPCEKCPAGVHLTCLPEGHVTPGVAPGKWLCSYHDENESMCPIMIHDVVWCKDGNYPFWPARVVPWEDVPASLAKRHSKAASGFYTVHYFQPEGSKAKEYAFLSSQRVLPFEEQQCSKDFLAGRNKKDKLYGAILNAIEYFKILQQARDMINSKTFQIFSASWEYITIANNQPMQDVQYTRSIRKTTSSKQKAIKSKADTGTTPTILTASINSQQSSCNSVPSNGTVEAAPTNDADANTSNNTASSSSAATRRNAGRRAAATKCTSILVDFSDCDSNYSKCACRKEPCDPLTCLNAIGKIECNEQNCRYSPNECGNRRLAQFHAAPGPTKRYNTTLKVVNCGARGKGLKAKVEFKRGDYIIEYVGEVINLTERETRETELFKKYDQPMFYFMSLDAKRVLDAQHKGNISRFANHSCDPNANISRVTYQGDYHIVLQACKDISANEEITYNYDWGTKGKNPMACFCGAANCGRVIGEKSNASSKKRKRDDDDGLEKAAKKKKTKKIARKGRGRGRPTGAKQQKPKQLNDNAVMENGTVAVMTDDAAATTDADIADAAAAVLPTPLQSSSSGSSEYYSAANTPNEAVAAATTTTPTPPGADGIAKKE